MALSLKASVLTLCLSLNLTLFSISSNAQEALFGSEWTFTNSEIVDHFKGMDSPDDRMLLKSKWLEKIQEKCPACEILGSKVVLPSGLWFQIEKDLWVLEVNAKPMTLAEIREHKDTLQALIWDTAFEVGLKPHHRVGGGHIHLDIAGHFKGDDRLFRNFIVDIFNRPELFMGALSLDYLNAPPFAVLGSSAIDTFTRVLNRFDQGEISLNLLLNGILKSYRLSEDFGTTRIGDLKYQVLNFNHSETLELRGFRPQVSAEHFLLLAELLSARITTLARYTQPISYIPKNYLNLVRTVSFEGMEHYLTELDPYLSLDALIDYVHSAGLKPLTYAPLITEELKLKLDQPAEQYMRTKAQDSHEFDGLTQQCFGFLKSA